MRMRGKGAVCGGDQSGKSALLLLDSAEASKLGRTLSEKSTLWLAHAGLARLCAGLSGQHWVRGRG